MGNCSRMASRSVVNCANCSLLAERSGNSGAVVAYEPAPAPEFSPPSTEVGTVASRAAWLAACCAAWIFAISRSITSTRCAPRRNPPMSWGLVAKSAGLALAPAPNPGIPRPYRFASLVATSAFCDSCSKAINLARRTNNSGKSLVRVDTKPASSGDPAPRTMVSISSWVLVISASSYEICCWNGASSASSAAIWSSGSRAAGIRPDICDCWYAMSSRSTSRRLMSSSTGAPGVVRFRVSRSELSILGIRLKVARAAKTLA